MSNKLMVAVSLLVCVSSAIAGPTVAELSSINAELKMQELQNKLSEAKNKHSTAELPPGGAAMSGGLGAPASGPSLPPPMPTLAGATVESEEIRLQAIYGIEDNLKAEVLYNGNSFTLSKNEPGLKLGSWTVTGITPFSLILSKPIVESKGGKGGKGGAQAAKKEVFLSSGTTTSGDTKNLNLYAPGGAQGVPTMLPALPVPNFLK